MSIKKRIQTLAGDIITVLFMLISSVAGIAVILFDILMLLIVHIPLHIVRLINAKTGAVWFFIRILGMKSSRYVPKCSLFEVRDKLDKLKPKHYGIKTTSMARSQYFRLISSQCKK